MDSSGRLDESSPLLECSSFQRREEPPPSRRAYVVIVDSLKRLWNFITRISSMGIILIAVLSALVYLAMPIGIHIYLTGGYYDLDGSHIKSHDKSHNESHDHNTTTDGPFQKISHVKAMTANTGVGNGDCPFPSTVKTMPALPILPANNTLVSYCYGVNASDISKLEICTDTLRNVKIEMGQINVANSPLSKALFGLSRDSLYAMLNLGLGLLFGKINDNWPDCTPYVKQAICQFLFPPLVGGLDTVLEFNQSMCYKARDSKCHEGWLEADKVINKFVTKCNKTHPILNLLHMPYCEQMPEASLVEAPTCSFAGINFNTPGKTCYSYWQYPKGSLIAQDFVFLSTIITTVVLSLAGFTLLYMNRVTGQIFPNFILAVMSICLLLYCVLILVMYFSFVSKHTQANWFCPHDSKNISMIEAVESNHPTNMCKFSVFIYQYLTMSVTSMWLASLILASTRMSDDVRNARPSVGRRFSNVGLALFTCFISLLPLIINALDNVDMTIPRRPTVICAFRDSTRAFYSYTFPMSVMSFTGIVLLAYLVLKMHKELARVRVIDRQESVAGELQNFPLKSVLRFLLFHIFVAIVIVPFVTLGISTQLSAKMFPLDLLPINHNPSYDRIPILGLMVPLIPAFISVFILLGFFSLDWCCTNIKQK